MGVFDSVKSATFSATINTVLNYLDKDPEKNLVKAMNLVDKVTPEGWFGSQRDLIRDAVYGDGIWHQFIMRLFDLDPGLRRTAFQNFLINAGLKGTARQDEVKEKEGCNVPWAILLDPTSACNLHCTGCWAAEYGNKLNLSLEEIDSIVKQGKELGVYMYIYTGGEPLVRKKDLIKICEMHKDCEFLCFTNGTLIDEDFCKEMVRVGNFAPAISLEGFETANDGRRGSGVFQKVLNAMKLMKEHGILYGVSVCYTSANCEDVTTDEFVDMLIENGAYYVWYFHYMPVGNDADTSLLLKPEQREMMYNAIRRFRQTKSIFSMDFQNDAEFVGGCIAGGRRYLHINPAGDVEPCVFIHFSNANIRECTLLEALKSPLFMAYHDGQPFNDNMLRPCPMLENPDLLQKMAKNTGAKSTDLQSPESAEHLCSKTQPYAENWKGTAERIWEDSLKAKEEKAKQKELEKSASKK